MRFSATVFGLLIALLICACVVFGAEEAAQESSVENLEEEKLEDSSEDKPAKTPYKEPTYPTYDGNFVPELRCQACVLFADQVWTLMAADQGSKTMTAQRRRQYCAREDRIEIILERALKRSSMMFMWEDDDEGSRPKAGSEGKIRGRYWSIPDIVKHKGMPRESQEMLKQGLSAGGDLGMNHFIQSEILEEHAEDIEEMIGKPIGGTKYTHDKHWFAANMCSVMVPVCSKRSFEDQGYDDEVHEEAGGRTYISWHMRLFPFDRSPNLKTDDAMEVLWG